MIKTCISCKIEYELSNFNKNKSSKDGYRSKCKNCSTSYARKYYKLNSSSQKKLVVERNKKYRKEIKLYLFKYLKSIGCVDCKKEYDPSVLDFDHVRGSKKMIISKMVTGCYSLKTIKEEIDKCEVRCANCHRRKTAKDFSWYKDIYGSVAQMDRA